ncbi:olfactory receptor 52P1 [Alligator mississippiensis]|uniref:olfactory receptor 52P1 n=1 Tax=Alligator mississippiensis TaxID=8496 RepID=UPI0028772B2E|nr:olfactory receptor 52P1 [Alligator mississippiensis]
MANPNGTTLHPSIFFLIGVPGLEDLHIWISIPFCTIYIFSLLGNCLLLVIIKTEPSLHQPMYLFLAMLAIADLVVSSTTLPKILTIFWFNNGYINIDACLAQIFLVHSVSSMESGFILALSFDRYVAICNPLRHSVILTNRVIAKIGLGVVVRGAVLLSPHPFLLKWLPYCGTNIIAHTYCEFMALAKLACADTSSRRAYSLTVAFLTAGVDLVLIVVSYILILCTVFRFPSKEARLKSLGTCSSHICVILVSYTPAFFSFLTHRFGHSVAPHIHIIIANIYLLVPSMFDPIIYGVMTKKIRERALRIFFPRCTQALS